MLVNDLIALLLQIPPKLAAGWGVWFFAGLVLSIWQRREKSRLIVHAPTPRQKPGPPPSPKPAASAPASSGDPFSELAALLDSPQEPTATHHRRPGEELTEVTGSNGRPLMASPQSLP